MPCIDWRGCWWKPVLTKSMGHCWWAAPESDCACMLLLLQGPWGGGAVGWWGARIICKPLPYLSSHAGGFVGMVVIVRHVQSANVECKCVQSLGRVPVLGCCSRQVRRLHRMWWSRPFCLAFSASGDIFSIWLFQSGARLWMATLHD